MSKLTLLPAIILALFSSTVFADKDTGPTYKFNGKSYQLEKIEDFSFLYRNQVRGEERQDADLSSYPQTMNLRENQTEVKDQGMRGACSFFATAGLIEGSIKTFQNETVNISEEYMIYVTKGINKKSAYGDGSHVYNNLVASVEHGLTIESEYAYQTDWFAKGLPCENVEKNSSAPAYCYSHYQREVSEDKLFSLPESAVKWVETLSNENMSDNIIKSMNETGLPQSSSIALYSSLWDGSTGIAGYDDDMLMQCDTNPDCGGHAIVLTGYDLEKKVFFFKNSWGSSWGDSGYGTIAFDYINRWSRSTYTIYIDIENKVEFPTSEELDLPTIKENMEVSHSFLRFENNHIVTSLTGDFKLKPFMTGNVFMMLYIEDEEGKLSQVYDASGTPIQEQGVAFRADINGDVSLSDLGEITAIDLSKIPEGTDLTRIKYYAGVFLVSDIMSYTPLNFTPTRIAEKVVEEAVEELNEEENTEE